MFYYSQAISEFTTKLHRLANHILISEMRIKALRTRFEFNGYRYPLSFITFEKPNTLGFFDPDFLQIGIHRHFLFICNNERNDELLKNVLRHELLHYIAHLKYGSHIDAHGTEYRSLAKSFNYPKEVYSSSYDNYQGKIILKEQTQEFKVLEKVKKLLGLSENNNNSHEAQSALIKAKRLLTQHNLSMNLAINKPAIVEDQEFVIKIINQGKRVGSKVQSISQVLSHFFVKPIFNHSQSKGYRLEIFGMAQDIELAHYIFDYLNLEMERLWEQARKQYKLKGLQAKNSFFWGLSDGYLKELNRTSENSSNNSQKTTDDSRSLILKDQALQRNFEYCYQSKRSSKIGAKSDPQSNKLGRAIGKKLNINLPLSKKIRGLLS